MIAEKGVTFVTDLGFVWILNWARKKYFQNQSSPYMDTLNYGHTKLYTHIYSSPILGIVYRLILHNTLLIYTFKYFHRSVYFVY